MYYIFTQIGYPQLIGKTTKGTLIFALAVAAALQQFITVRFKISVRFKIYVKFLFYSIFQIQQSRSAFPQGGAQEPSPGFQQGYPNEPRQENRQYFILRVSFTLSKRSAQPIGLPMKAFAPPCRLTDQLPLHGDVTSTPLW